MWTCIGSDHTFSSRIGGSAQSYSSGTSHHIRPFFSFSPFSRSASWFTHFLRNRRSSLISKGGKYCIDTCAGRLNIIRSFALDCRRLSSSLSLSLPFRNQSDRSTTLGNARIFQRRGSSVRRSTAEKCREQSHGTVDHSEGFPRDVLFAHRQRRFELGLRLAAAAGLRTCLGSATTVTVSLDESLETIRSGSNAIVISLPKQKYLSYLFKFSNTEGKAPSDCSCVVIASFRSRCFEFQQNTRLDQSGQKHRRWSHVSVR